jgi:hypothetical protein
MYLWWVPLKAQWLAATSTYQAPTAPLLQKCALHQNIGFSNCVSKQSKTHCRVTRIGWMVRLVELEVNSVGLILVSSLRFPCWCCRVSTCIPIPDESLGIPQLLGLAGPLWVGADCSLTKRWGLCLGNCLLLGHSTLLLTSSWWWIKLKSNSVTHNFPLRMFKKSCEWWNLILI